MPANIKFIPRTLVEAMHIVSKYLLITIVMMLLSCGRRGPHPTEHLVFRYNQPDGITSLDPAFARSQANIWAAAQLFNGLLELDASMKVQPCLAREWSLSEDGLIYTFKLRDSVFFHEDPCFYPQRSRKVNAQDVVYSFKRIIKPETASPGAWIFSDKVRLGEDGQVHDSAFVAIDSLTLAIHLKKPFPAFAELLAMPYAYIIPQEAIRVYGKEFRTNPVGTGPFAMKEWEEAVHLMFKRNPNYWRIDENGEQLPYLQAVHISFINDKNQEFLTFMQGKLDFVTDLTETSREMLFKVDGSLIETYSSQLKVVKGPYLNTEYIGIQTDASFYEDSLHPLLDRRVRQALNFGIDKENLMRYVLYQKGRAAVHGFVPPVLYGKGAMPQGYSYQPARAAELLKEAGFPGGKGMPELALYTTSLYPYKGIAEFLQKQWSTLGIRVRIETGATASIREMIDQGKVFLFRASWLGDYPDPENYFAVLYSANFAPAGPNKMRFKDLQYDLRYEQSLKLQTLEERQILYREMDSLLILQAPVIPLFYDEVVRIIHKEVRGLEPNAMNTLILERVKKSVDNS